MASEIYSHSTVCLMAYADPLACNRLEPRRRFQIIGHLF